MTTITPGVSGSVTIRDLRLDPGSAPGGAGFPDSIRRFLPLIHGAALAWIPEHPAAAADVATAVLESFVIRWRRLSRSTVVARWLWRSTWFASVRERRRLGLPARAGTPEGLLAQALYARLNRLKARAQDVLILRLVLQEPVEAVAKAVGRKESRVAKGCERGLAKLTKPLRKRAVKLGISTPAGPSGSVPAAGPGGPFDLRAFMAGIPRSPAEEAEQALLAKLREWSPTRERSGLVVGTLRSWRWVAVGRFCRGLLKGAGVAAVLLVLFGATMVYLAQHGYLTLWFVRRQQQSLLVEFPELARPARPWPDPAVGTGAVASVPPATAAELYGLTNIWPATLRLTAEQWKAMQPLPVPPAQGRDGRMPLRNPKASRSGLAGAIGIDFPWSAGRLEFAGRSFDPVGVRYRGNGTFINSLHGSKQSFKVDLNRPVKGREVGGVATLNFVNSIPDFSYLKDALAQRLFRELGAVGPRTAYAYLSLDVPGSFTNQALGLYVLIENIDSDFARDRFGSKETPIFKPVTYELFADWGPDWKAYSEVYDLKTKATPEQRARVVEFVQLVSHADQAEFARRLPEYLDLEEYAGFLAGHVLMSSYDGYLSNGQNFYVYLDPRSNRLGFIPWDQDHGWGEFSYIGTAEGRERASIWHPASGANRFLERVLEVPAFRDIYRRKLEQALQGPFTEAELFPAIDALADRIRPAVAAESAFRLQRFELAVSTNWVSGPRDGSMRDGSAEGPKAPAHQLKRFIRARVESVRAQLEGRSEGERIGGH